MKNNKYIRFLIFLAANFLALQLGSILMKNGPQTAWYTSLDKAPWTPEGWVFGVAWTTIMLCFAFYMTTLSFQYKFLDVKLLKLYTIQWLLNVSWNYVFFNKHLMLWGLIVIVLLLLLVGFFAFNYGSRLRWYSLLIIPYLIWMTIATSLNAYIVINN